MKRGYQRRCEVVAVMWRGVSDSRACRRVPGTGLAVAGIVGLLIVAGCGGGGGGQAQRPLQLVLIPIADGFDRPNYVTSANDGTGRLFVVEQKGTIRIVTPSGQVLAEPFLDLSDVVHNDGEAGLLSVAFHPAYEQNGRLFVHFVSRRSGSLTSYISEFRVAALNSDRVDGASEQVILTQRQNTAFHNGGLVTFGPEGYLWAGFGDGGGPERDNAQDRTNLLGSIIRIDVNTGFPYAIPDDNPFAGRQETRNEIFAYGFRNPWRFSVDPRNGDLFVGDVGQQDWEEIDLVESGGNYGWPIMEGAHCFPPGTDCNQATLELPIHEYAHSLPGCSITGGYVYRGNRYTRLRGTYFYADFCTGAIYSLTEDGEGWTAELERDSDLRISSFGLDEDGEMYVVDLDGGIYRMDFEPADDE